MQSRLASSLRIIVTLILIALLLAGSTWFYRLQLLDFLERGQVTTHENSDRADKRQKTARLETPLNENPQDESTAGASKTSPSTELSPKPSTTKGLSVVRINPGGGGGVIAGHGDPNMTVTVTADGEVVGTAKAGADGDWVLVTPHQFKTKDPKIAFTQSKTAKPVRVAKASDGQAGTGVINKPSPGRLNANAPAGKREPAAKTGSAAAVSARLVQDLEKMVETARRSSSAKKSVAETSQQHAPETAPQPAKQKNDGRNLENPNDTSTTPLRSASEGTPDTSNRKVAVNSHAPSQQSRLDFSNNLGRETLQKPDESRVATTEPSLQQNDWRARQTVTRESQTKSVPVPIGFEYRKATLTSEGRKAIALLSEYLRLKKFKHVVLTGHADERGTQALNMELSQERLDAVARHLKNAGFEGELKLIPKGETEPFRGVDRKLFSKEELYKLDRRVELVDSR